MVKLNRNQLKSVIEKRQLLKEVHQDLPFIFLKSEYNEKIYRMFFNREANLLSPKSNGWFKLPDDCTDEEIIYWSDAIELLDEFVSDSAILSNRSIESLLKEYEKELDTPFLKLRDGTLVERIVINNEFFKGYCETCDYGDHYISNLSIIVNGNNESFTVKSESSITESDLIIFIANNYMNLEKLNLSEFRNTIRIWLSIFDF